MTVKFTNNARSTLANSISDTDTVIRVRVGHGSKFPVIAETGDWFPLALEDDSGNIEYLRATARSGDSITVQRGSEGSQARAYGAGDVCELRLTSEALTAAITSGQLPGTIPRISISDGNISS